MSKFENKTILITGSNGFLGKAFVSALSKVNNTKLILIDNFIVPNNIDSKQNQHTFIQCDINVDLKETLKNYKFDYIINAAGIASPHWYNKFQLETLQVNLDGSRNILNLAKDHNAEVLMFSSSEVYGTPLEGNIPTKETYIGQVPTLTKRSAYDIGKLVTETLSYVYHNIGVNVKIVRPFNFVGPGLSSTDGRVLPNFMSKVLKNENIIIYGDGKQTRTFCHISDAIDGCLKVLENGKSGEAYNIGNSLNEISMLDFANKIIKLTNSKSQIELIQRPLHYETEPLRRCPDVTKAEVELNYKANVNVDDIIIEFYNWAKLEYK